MTNCKNFDAQIVDWLYDELDAPEKAAFRAHMDSCAACADDIASLTRVREVVSSLPRVEPPAAVSDIVMHQANKLAASGDRTAWPGDPSGILAWLGRWSRPVFAHPAAAAMASLILIVAVGGTLYLRGGGDLTEPVVSQHEADVEVPSPPLRGASLAPGWRTLDHGQAPGETSGQTPADDETESANALRDSKLAAASATDEVAASLEQEKKGDGSAVKPEAERGDTSTMAVPSGAVARSQRAAEKSRVAPTRTRAWLEGQRRELDRARQQGRCGDVARIANDIRARDRAYYDRDVVRTKRLGACTEEVRAETTRRSRGRRANQAAKSRPVHTDEAVQAAESDD